MIKSSKDYSFPHACDQQILVHAKLISGTSERTKRSTETRKCVVFDKRSPPVSFNWEAVPRRLSRRTSRILHKIKL
uniref:Uncharacterized protein n=1 Tax=Physcomitrium patens TaxID=3218 RepID=A0A2K1KIJ6_PHYPA|nr:hypothetical protein PHYPA_007258 [Physcomitrium patens]